MTDRSLAGVLDPKHRPDYSLPDAARFLGLSQATLRSWVSGRSYPKLDGEGHFVPLIVRPVAGDPHLSFANLVEAHVLRALRVQHGVSLRAVRRALDYSQRELSIERLLIHPDLQTQAGELFLKHYGDLINLSRAGQLALRRVLDQFLRRIEWDHSQLVRLFPAIDSLQGHHSVALDPNVAFGRPVIWPRAITTGVIAMRVNAGESVADVAADYGASVEEVEAALLYELAA